MFFTRVSTSLISLLMTTGIASAGCNPPDDVSTCITKDPVSLVRHLESQSSLSNPVILKLGQSGKQFGVRVISTGQFKNGMVGGNGNCNPPDDISGCDIIVPKSLQKWMRSQPNSPFVMSGKQLKLYAVPLPE